LAPIQPPIWSPFRSIRERERRTLLLTGRAANAERHGVIHHPWTGRFNYHGSVETVAMDPIPNDMLELTYGRMRRSEVSMDMEPAPRSLRRLSGSEAFPRTGIGCATIAPAPSRPSSASSVSLGRSPWPPLTSELEEEGASRHGSNLGHTSLIGQLVSIQGDSI